MSNMSYHPLIKLLRNSDGSYAAPVWVVDEDEVRESISFALQPHFGDVRSHSSSEGFLSQANLHMPGCVVTDMHTRGLDGRALLDYLKSKESPMTIIFLSSRADVRSAVAAMEAGAVSFFEKPVDPELLAPAVERAIRISVRRYVKTALLRLVGNLSPRERQIFEMICQGFRNTEIAEKLFLSQRTVEVHRAHIARKLGSAGPIRILYEMSLANDDHLFAGFAALQKAAK